MQNIKETSKTETRVNNLVNIYRSYITLNTINILVILIFLFSFEIVIASSLSDHFFSGNLHVFSSQTLIKIKNSSYNFSIILFFITTINFSIIELKFISIIEHKLKDTVNWKRKYVFSYLISILLVCSLFSILILSSSLFFVVWEATASYAITWGFALGMEEISIAIRFVLAFFFIVLVLQTIIRNKIILKNRKSKFQRSNQIISLILSILFFLYLIGETILRTPMDNLFDKECVYGLSTVCRIHYLEFMSLFDFIFLIFFIIISIWIFTFHHLSTKSQLSNLKNQKFGN